MANRSKLTAEQIAAIPRLYANGLTEAEIGAKFGVSAMTIHRHRHPEYYAKTKDATRRRQRENLANVQRTRMSNHKSINLSFHKENDAAIIEQLAHTENVQGYIRGLIMADVRRHQAHP